LVFFTSKTTGIFISAKQIKVFQDEKNGASLSHKDKFQYFVPFSNILEISSSYAKIVQLGTEYIAASNKQTELEAVLDKLSNLPIGKFDSNGITRENAVTMCQHFDANQNQGKPHPLTAEQIMLNKANSIKQKEQYYADKDET